MKKPTTVAWISGLILFRFIVILLVLTVTITVIYLNPEKGFFTGFANSILQRFDISEPFDNPDSTAGYLTGMFLITILLIICEYLFLRKRKRIGFWIIFALDTLSVIALHSFPLIPIIIFILGIRKSTQLYFQSDTITHDKHL
jgi:hypothetical protein